MTPSPSIPERCSPLDLASPVMLRGLLSYGPNAVAGIKAHKGYTDAQKEAAIIEVEGVINNLRNIVTLAALESQLP